MITSYGRPKNMSTESTKEGLEFTAEGVACVIANYIAAVPILREQIEILTRALQAAEKENARLREQINKMYAVVDDLSFKAAC